MSHSVGAPNPIEPHLERRLGLAHATALNMLNMVGIGPFITIPLLMSAMGGPQALLGWIVAAIICIPDGMVWSELGAAMPGSGGSYVYLREGYGRETWGRLMAFLFIWQFVFSGPLELASGYIGFGQYLSFILPGMTNLHMSLIAAGVGLLNILLLFRGIQSVGKLTLGLWAIMLTTVACVIFTGIRHFDPKVAFDFPPDAFQFSWGFLWGLGAAARVGVYDYLGYYDVCYVGEEVRDPGRVIPRSVIISVCGVGLIYLVMNISIIGNISWREFVPAADGNPVSRHLVSVFMERIYGRGFAVFFTVMVLVTTLASVFALLLGYSRIPYAAAREGYFFHLFSRLHPKKDFPYMSLLAVGAMSILACFLSLQTVIEALVTCRILVQFVGQIFAVILLRRRSPEMRRPYRIWLYPIPCLIALVGWMFVFSTSSPHILLFSMAALGAGMVAFLIWSRITHRWPFAADRTA